jgi:hypothetical protein
MRRPGALGSSRNVADVIFSVLADHFRSPAWSHKLSGNAPIDSTIPVWLQWVSGKSYVEALFAAGAKGRRAGSPNGSRGRPGNSDKHDICSPNCITLILDSGTS